MSVATFLFTDIEGATPRWEAAPDAMRVALETHNETLRKAVEVHAGHVLNYTGEGMCAVCDSPRSAVDAAVGGVQEGCTGRSRATSTVNRRGHYPRYPGEIPAMGE